MAAPIEFKGNNKIGEVVFAQNKVENGKVVASGSLIAAYQNHELNTENLSNGMYALKVFNSGSVSINKVSIKK